MPTAASGAPLRLFLDAGVLVDGFFNFWGTCKGVLILCTLRTHFRAIIAEPIGEEFANALARKTEGLPEAEYQKIEDGVKGWMHIACPIEVGWPSEDEMLAHGHLLAAVRHENDMPGVVAAVLARPDWILSTNTDHWGEELARRTGLNVATPAAFLSRLHP